MKTGLFLASFFLVFQLGSSSWLGDVFTGLTEPLEDAIKDDEGKVIWDTVKEKVTDNVKTFAKDHMELVDVVKDKMNEGVKMLKSKGFDELANKASDLLEEAEEKGEEIWLEESSNIKEKLLKQWNKLMQKVTDGKEKLKFKKIVHKFRKLHQKLRSLIPENLYKEMEEKANALLMKLKVKLPMEKVKKMKDDLTEHVKDWTQPSFMKKAAQKLEKEDVKEAVQAAAQVVNSHLDDVVDKVEPLVKKVTGAVKKEKEEKKIERFVGDFFKKPHTESGTGPWENILGKVGEDALDMLKKNEKVVSHGEKVASYLKEALSNGETIVVDQDDADDEDDDGDEHNDQNTKTDDDDNDDDEMDAKDKEEFEKAEKQWEKNVEAETKRLLTKLKPAKAYKIPEIKAEMPKEEKETPKPIFTGNENWNVYKKYQKQQEKNERNVGEKIRDGFPFVKKLMNTKFSKDLSDVTSGWMDLKRGLMKKMDKMEKRMMKKF